MKTEQLSVFLENRAGRLAEVTHTLGEAGINIRALSLADTSDFGILRMIVCDHEKAKVVLKEKGFTLGRTSVVAVEVPDTPGGLDSVLQTVSKNGINVEYMYAFVQREAESAVAAGCTVFLPKPFTQAELHKMLNTCLVNLESRE